MKPHDTVYASGGYHTSYLVTGHPFANIVKRPSRSTQLRYSLSQLRRRGFRAPCGRRCVFGGRALRCALPLALCLIAFTLTHPPCWPTDKPTPAPAAPEPGNSTPGDTAWMLVSDWPGAAHGARLRCFYGGMVRRKKPARHHDAEHGSHSG